VQFTFPWRQARGTLAVMDVAMRFEVMDECLAGMGYASGTPGLVRRYRRYVETRRELGLLWRPAPAPPASMVVEAAVHPGGQFILDVAASGVGRLVHVWPGLGRRTIGTGTPDEMRSEALRVLQAGGPFGGPTSARTGERVVQLTELHGGVRRPLPDGSELRVLPLEQISLGVRIWPDGRFAQMPMASAHDDPSKMIEDDTEHLIVGSTSTPWTFIDLHPLLGIIRAPPYTLLLCPLKADLVAVIAVQGLNYGLNVGSWADIRAKDPAPWLEDLTASIAREKAAAATRAASGAEKATGAAPGVKQAAEATPGAEKVASTAGPAAAKAAATPPTTDQGRPPGATTGDKPASKRRKRVATSPGGMPGPRARRTRLKPALAAAITQHLAGVAPDLPTGVLGAAVAIELLRALEAAALSDPPTWTGTTTELFSRLYKKGFLASIPADQAGRAALKLLADRSPLVRRLHYRRWCFAFGDIHEPASALRGRLGVIAE
jgi:hypothetical protein